ncbi:hypothetical protein AMS58_10245 [Pseudoalteromonas porphyrae]|uniref:Uncharacterized protein n=1 Tax=Pseudoalteromonas porphyrae TaxID=187330 RepID=A0A0N1ENX1_9GAMM|nr:MULTISPECIES: hypothetical protein [Pseudoalteromonas]KPH57736.1 hypothetical protein ADS77_18735 [Pseudoalteromonas porphyrae]KPH94883.1 hypothetical protein AMS58_10245 [Pseudoalteromonas porphyrae]
MKRFKFTISYFVLALLLSAVYYYQEGSFNLSGTLIFASIILVMEVSVYFTIKLYKKYKKPLIAKA